MRSQLLKVEPRSFIYDYKQKYDAPQGAVYDHPVALGVLPVQSDLRIFLEVPK